MRRAGVSRGLCGADGTAGQLFDGLQRARLDRSNTVAAAARHVTCERPLGAGMLPGDSGGAGPPAQSCQAQVVYCPSWHVLPE